MESFMTNRSNDGYEILARHVCGWDQIGCDKIGCD